MNIQFSLSANVSANLGLGNGSNPPTNGREIEADGLNNSVGQSTQSKNLEQQLRQLESVSKELSARGTTLDISVHDKTHQIMVKVLDKETGELIREVPPEKIVNLVASMMEMAGIIVDKKL
ncbi:flagellar protein FlaG [Paenibacillus sp. 453mf]|uniref:flagellar protein FlaG n=1 Tax=Paenibacillus sp. 453mf TaxID=1761874 RepID=UPI0008F0AD1D|nr:flagellar protein FlaG [Paenibacillus sp. 453mf]SFS85264.1 flagellar protein FlaG [Paenibacillus sp. 453mf]